VLYALTAASARDLPAIAVNDLSAEGVEASEARLISDRFRSELINSGAFRVMERGEMERILEEQGFQKSGACDDRTCAVEIGQILGVRQMLTGSIGKVGDVVTVNARMIDVATGEILYSVSADCRSRMSDVLTQTTPQLAAEIVRKEDARASGRSTSRPAQPATATARKPLLRRAGFWVPVGLVMAGGATVAIILLSGDDEADTPAPQPTETGGIRFTW